MRFRILGAAAALLFSVTLALAQSPSVSPAEQTRFKEWVVKTEIANAAVPAGFTLAVGAEIPSAIPVYEVPARTLRIDALINFRYALIGGKIGVIERSDRKVLLVIN